MRKLLIAASILLSTTFISCGNVQIIDTTWHYNKAIIMIGNKSIEVDIESWRDYDDTSIQVKSTDGKVYLTDLKNVLLISE